MINFYIQKKTFTWNFFKDGSGSLGPTPPANNVSLLISNAKTTWKLNRHYRYKLRENKSNFPDFILSSDKFIDLLQKVNLNP